MVGLYLLFYKQQNEKTKTITEDPIIPPTRKIYNMLNTRNYVYLHEQFVNELQYLSAQHFSVILSN